METRSSFDVSYFNCDGFPHVSSSSLTDRIMGTYFTSLDTENQSRLYDNIRNFIVTLQEQVRSMVEANENFKPTNPRPPVKEHEDGKENVDGLPDPDSDSSYFSSSDDDDDSECLDESEIEMVRPEEVGQKLPELGGVAFTDKEPIDIIPLYQCVRNWYESEIGLPFVTFNEFYLATVVASR
jgi:hypothetical protein